MVVTPAFHFGECQLNQSASQEITPKEVHDLNLNMQDASMHKIKMPRRTTILGCEKNYRPIHANFKSVDFTRENTL